ncbi:MAG: calcium/proton exchanger [Chloroflexota bacterium]|nr:calcium/proton exchanger [Chloroflexota bacterium]
MNFAGVLDRLGRKAAITFGASLLLTVLSALLQFSGANSVLRFSVSALALAALAALVGEATDQLGHRLGPGATGVLQSALGNLPELFISIFALRAGLIVVVQAALVGSILANSLLVLGIAFLAGGLKNGVQKFGTTQTRMISVLLVLSVASLAIPALATSNGAPDAGHAEDLSVLVAVALLVIFIASIPFSLKGGPGASAESSDADNTWPMSLTLVTLVGAASGAAFVSDWFVEALKPAMATLGLSEAFVGLVIVAIAGNAVENVVGVQMALRNKADLAISLILNSSLQVALALFPALVIISQFMVGAHLTLVLSPLLIGSLALTVLLGAFIVYDGESTWLEGLALIGLYVIIAGAFWWGPAIVP